MFLWSIKFGFKKGQVAERFKALVLKTIVFKNTMGSNPILSFPQLCYWIEKNTLKSLKKGKEELEKNLLFVRTLKI